MMLFNIMASWLLQHHGIFCMEVVVSEIKPTQILECVKALRQHLGALSTKIVATKKELLQLCQC